MKVTLQEIIEKYQKDVNRLMDILLVAQKELGCISNETISTIAKELNISAADVEQTRSFYHFFTTKPAGKYAVYVDDSVVANMKGRAEIVKAFETEANVKLGSVSADGLVGLFNTACIGMSDQSPAALINGTVYTNLTPAKVKEIVAGFKAEKCAKEILSELGDGKNASENIKSMVKNNILRKGEITFSEYEVGSALKKAVTMSADEVINEVKTSTMRGRGGAGFPTGMKWAFCKKEADPVKYILCNADEGEPGTFKDRVLLTELSEQVFEGMAIAGYAIGAKEGILYLRHEYKYMKKHLDKVLEDLKTKNLLGTNIAGKQGFDFEIRIQLGAGAYVCGEESALIESCEGRRGEPRYKPPFPAQIGYKLKPTVINNVETLIHVTRIVTKGGAWYKSIGTKESAGTKVLSISGDCEKPGVYEIAWGMSVTEMLEMCGAKDVQAVQIAGPSGACINPSQFDRKISYEDLATGGSMTVIGNKRNLLKDVVLNYMDFFVDESCGSCVPCRALSVLMKERLEKVIAGHATNKEVDEMVEWGAIMKSANRCGLGQTASNPITSTIENFRSKYDELTKNVDFISEFDMAKSVAASCVAAGRTPNL